MTAYTQIFDTEQKIYTDNKDNKSIDSTTLDVLQTNPIDIKLLDILGENNQYSKSLEDVIGNLELDSTSLNTKDAFANYSLVFKTKDDTTDSASITVSNSTVVAKGAEIGSGNEAVKEEIKYANNSFGDKLTVNHVYKTKIVKDSSDTTTTSEIKSDKVTQVFTAETGAKAIKSALTTETSYNQSLVKDAEIVKVSIKEVFTFNSPIYQINSSDKTDKVTTNEEDTSSVTSKSVNYNDKTKDAAYSLSYSYSTNENIAADKLASSRKLTFKDDLTSIVANDSSVGSNVSGNLKVTTAEFSLVTSKVMTIDTLKNLIALTEDTGYGSKAGFDGYFVKTEDDSKTLTGTNDADVIKINTLKSVAAPRGEDAPISLVLNVDAGEGNDTITGSAGGDSITGGEGNDVFVIGNKDSGSITITSSVTTTNKDGTTIVYEAELKGSDTITDFKGSETDDTGKVITKGDDKLSLGVAGSNANYNESTGPVADFSEALTMANDALSKLTAKGERFAFQFDDESGYLFNDVNGDGKADQVIILTGVDNEHIAAVDIVK